MKSGQKNAKAMTRVITQNGNNSINSVMEQKMTINGVSTCTIAGAEKYEKSFEDAYDDVYDTVKDAINEWVSKTGIEQGERTEEQMVNFINKYEYENGETYFYIRLFTFE